MKTKINRVITTRNNKLTNFFKHSLTASSTQSLTSFHQTD